MKRRSILMVVIAVLVFTALTGALATGSNLSRFKVENHADSQVYIQLTGGPSRYYLSHAPGQEYRWTIARGEYNYTLYACGATKSGTIDLTTNQSWVVPECGSKAYTTGTTLTTDVGRILRMVRLELTNGTSHSNLVVAVYGDGNLWVFTLPKGDPQNYTVPKGTYSYIAYGCGGSWRGTIYANHPRDNSVTFKCP